MSATPIIGQSDWTASLRDTIAQVARFSSTVLVSGPSGTGKELIARAIHEQSSRRGGPFVPVDCTAVSGDLFAGHLFGHVAGAFTGAHHARLGCFRAADGGTILLDEIGELSLELQSKLLRTIQQRMVVPLGSEQPQPVDVRIVAATNRNLRDEVQAGRFRLDLYYRLNVVSIRTLALAERRDEIEPLANYFLDKFTAEQGLARKQFAASALAALVAHGWPGNVRELQNVVERAVVFSPGRAIGAEAIAFDTPPAAQPPLVPPALRIEAHPADDDAAWSTLADVEREHIRATLERAYYNQSLAARLLGIDRASLARKIARHALHLPKARRGRPHRSSRQAGGG